MSPNDQEKVSHYLPYGSRVEMSEKHHGSLIDTLMLVCQYGMNCSQSPLQFYKGQCTLEQTYEQVLWEMSYSL